jgi:hypothetical protein
MRNEHSFNKNKFEFHKFNRIPNDELATLDMIGDKIHENTIKGLHEWLVSPDGQNYIDNFYTSYAFGNLRIPLFFKGNE